MITKNVGGKTQVLLMKRKNTGYNDGEYELPGGHLEANEDLFDAMIREAKEELLIDLKRENLKIVHLMHHYTGNRLNFIFQTNADGLNPQIGEKDKCERLIWVALDNLPDNTTRKVKQMLKNIQSNVSYDQM
jgi:8-oxo-dGTP pyrophosphatase MutT (NUDIX family)